MFNFKVLLFIVIVGVVLMPETEAHPKLKLKLKLLKAKLLAPHIAAKIAVAKKIKAKTAIAAAKTFDAFKAKKAAALSILTAPIQVAKKTLLIKAKKVKAVKAAKVVALAGATHALAKLKLKKPIILPVPVPVPTPFLGKGININKSLGLGGGLGLGGLGFPIGLSALSDETGSSAVQGLLSGAQKLISTAGASLPILSSLSNGFGSGVSKNLYLNKELPAPIVVQAQTPVYRFVPEVTFANYNPVVYQPPHVQVEVPHPHVPEPAEEFHTSSHGEVHELTHSEYGPPANTYGAPHF